MNTQEFDAFVTRNISAKELTRSAALLSLRENGASISQAIKAIREIFHVSLGEAKSVVASHPSWYQTSKNASALQVDAQDVFCGVQSKRTAAHL